MLQVTSCHLNVLTPIPFVVKVMEMEVKECTLDDYFEVMDVVHLLCTEV